MPNQNAENAWRNELLSDEWLRAHIRLELARLGHAPGSLSSITTGVEVARMGLPTVLVLVTNGLSLGTGFGVFANYHAGGYLGTFVAGHGVLELTAIFIAGGAGFRLAGAVLLPGDRTRRDALIVEGRVAARMIGAVVTLLAIAGTIEGLLSASDAPTGYKYLASGLSVVFLVIYFASGRAFLAQRRAPLGSGPQSQLLG